MTEIKTKNDLIPRWSPNGSQLAYANDRDGVSRPSGRPMASTSPPLGYPEGKKGKAVLVVPASGGKPPRRLTTPEERREKEGLVWHPDGERLTYAHHLKLDDPRQWSDSELRQAYLEDCRSSSLLVNRPDHWDYVGTWTPDGAHFFFLAWQAGVWRLNRYDAETRDFAATAIDTEGCNLPSWSPDRKTIVWEVRDSDSQLWMMNLR